MKGKKQERRTDKDQNIDYMMSKESVKKELKKS